jgi:hypothetical protein
VRQVGTASSTDFVPTATISTPVPAKTNAAIRLCPMPPWKRAAAP